MKIIGFIQENWIVILGIAAGIAFFAYGIYRQIRSMKESRYERYVQEDRTYKLGLLMNAQLRDLKQIAETSYPWDRMQSTIIAGKCASVYDSFTFYKSAVKHIEITEDVSATAEQALKYWQVEFRRALDEFIASKPTIDEMESFRKEVIDAGRDEKNAKVFLLIAELLYQSTMAVQ